jgi:CheY-like chemotaxis protein
MARVVALIPDLLFGSKVQAALVAAGHEVELVSDRAAVARRLGGGECDVLVVDLTDPDLDGPGLVEDLLSNEAVRARTHARAQTLGFYAHVDTAIRDRAERAGFDLVVPRSRMAREAAAIVSDLAG